MTISIITPTFERPELLARAAQSVLSQTVDAALEYIVVNDANAPLLPAAWMDDPRVQIIHTQRVERSEARNRGAAASTGEWLHFLDDDDSLLPGALAALLQTAQRSDAAIVFGGYVIHSVAGGMTRTILPTLAAEAFPAFFSDEMLPIGASWFRREAFFAAGQFDPALVQAEDVDLHRRLALQGTAAGTAAVVASLRIDHPRTSFTRFRANRRRWRDGLEKCIAMPPTLNHLRETTAETPYWRGRCARKYLSSAVYNLGRGRFILAGKRLRGWVALSAGHFRQRAFWNGLRKNGGGFLQSGQEPGEAHARSLPQAANRP